MWQYTIAAATLGMACFTLMGGGYIPWYITSIINSYNYRFILQRQKKVSTCRVAIASGVLHMD